MGFFAMLHTFSRTMIIGQRHVHHKPQFTNMTNQRPTSQPRNEVTTSPVSLYWLRRTGKKIKFSPQHHVEFQEGNGRARGGFKAEGLLGHMTRRASKFQTPDSQLSFVHTGLQIWETHAGGST